MQQGIPSTLDFLALLDVPADPAMVLNLPYVRNCSTGSISNLLGGGNVPHSSGANSGNSYDAFAGGSSCVLPSSLKVLRLGGRNYTVRRDSGSSVGGSGPSMAGNPLPIPVPFSSLSIANSSSSSSSSGGDTPNGSGSGASAPVLEEWPSRCAALHAEEWLEALGCSDGALWDDFAPGRYPVPLSAHAVIFGSGNNGYGGSSTASASSMSMASSMSPPPPPSSMGGPSGTSAASAGANASAVTKSEEGSGRSSLSGASRIPR